MRTPHPYPEDPELTRAYRALRSLGRGAWKTADLVRALKTTRGKVPSILRRLRASGVVLASDGKGIYRTQSFPDGLRPEAVLSHLPEGAWGRPYFACDEISSTNDLCHAMAQSGAPEGTVVVAETQSRGRGRLARTWFTPSGRALAFSLLLRPQLPPGRLSLLTLASAVGVAWAIEDVGGRPGIKWPNDVELDGRKVSGILTEGRTEPGRLQYAVVGVGFNVRTTAKDFPTELRDRVTSLADHLGRAVERSGFFARLLVRLQEAHALLASGKGDRLLKEGRDRSTVLGRQVRIRLNDRTLYGQALDVDPQGALHVRTDWGFIETVTAGDVERLRLQNVQKPRRGKTPRRRSGL